MLTGSSGFLVTAKAQTKTPDSALQLVKEQDVSSVEDLSLTACLVLRSLGDNNSKGLIREESPFPGASNCHQQSWGCSSAGDRNHCVSP